MTQSVRRQDRIVEDYLAAVTRACAALSPSRREELVSDLREHITVARGALNDPSEADVRAILDRLGEPAAIAAEASVGEPFRAPPQQRQRMSPVVIVAVLVFAAILVMLAAGLAVFALARP